MNIQDFIYDEKSRNKFLSMTNEDSLFYDEFVSKTLIPAIERLVSHKDREIEDARLKAYSLGLGEGHDDWLSNHLKYSK